MGEITAMCAVKDLLVLGFSNGVLILVDTDKLEICFSHKQFIANSKAIDKLKVNHCGDAINAANTPDQLSILFSLSDGLLSYHNFPKITLIDELVLEPNIIDFQCYSISSNSGLKRSFLATVHKTNELKIFRLKKKDLQYQYITQFRLDEVPKNFIVYRDIFVFTYTNHLEYVRVDGKGKESESITRINPLL